MQDKNQLPNRLIVLNRKLSKIIEELNDIAHLTGNEHVRNGKSKVRKQLVLIQIPKLLK